MKRIINYFLLLLALYGPIVVISSCASHYKAKYGYQRSPFKDYSKY